MSMHPLLTGGRGERHLLLTNEAIVRGALEAGVSLVSCYPGTPSSEVPDTFRKLGSDRYVLEYSVNEKVAFEVAAGAALAGGMALVTMKHVGLNVAADPLFTAAYSGLPGGLVLLSADDPGCHASQNEQDNRHYARAASLPCFEPASAAEAREMTREAFRMARELQQPVMLRTTTRVNHMRGPVEFGDLPAERSQVPFERNPGRFVAVPATARVRHRALVTAMKKAREFAENSRFNTEYGDAGVRTGIIVSGVSRNYLADALATGGWGGRVRVLELGMTWPLPEKKLLTFLSSCDRVLVLEEGDPLLESGVRELAQRHHCAVRVEGKDDLLTVQGEYSTTLLLRRLAQYLDCPCPALTSAAPAAEGLPNRPPNLCAGCSHRAVYYAVRQVFGDDAYYSNDIGCYTLGVLPPLRAADFLVCMGSSISTGSGFARVSGKPVVAFIGDSTFFHSGMTGLANASFCRLFGGDWLSMGIVLTSTITGMFLKQQMSKEGINPYLVFIVSAFVASLCSSSSLIFDTTSEIALATSVLYLVPGVPLINGVIDIVEGYILTGCARLIHALLLILCIATGLSFTLLLVKDNLL